jgi:hypothetical protein
MPFLGGRGQASRGYFGGGTTPGAPTSVVSTKGNGQISVAFTAPSFDGGLPITTYQYALSTDSYATWTTRSAGTTASPLVITGLTNGTSYGVKIRAVNSLGNGVASDAATAVIPSTVPGTPTSVSGTANGVTSSTVTWTAPANNGGAAVTGYKVEYALSPYSSYTVFNANTGTTATSISVTGLNNGGSYKFRVSATNLNGFGTTSAESGVVVTNIVPGAPTIGTMTRGTGGSTTDTLAWTAPTANGGSAITGYVYALSSDSYATATATTVFPGVSQSFNPGYTSTTTTVKIAAVNSLGTGPYSAASAVGFGGWALGAASDNTASCPSVSCSCAACDCGPSTGTNSTQTKTRNCYTWTRSGNDASPVYNSNGTTACTSAYSACSGGSCVSCSSCASYTSAAKTGDFSQGGISYTYVGPPGTYYAFPNPNCSSGCDFGTAYYSVTVCNGTNTITLTDAGLCYTAWGDPC